MNTSYMNWGSDFKKEEDDDDEEEPNSIQAIEVKSSKVKQKHFFMTDPIGIQNKIQKTFL